MARLPAQTSYFTISTFLSTNITAKTAIALDIMRQHYANKKAAGDNIRVLVVQGFGEHITFEEACLGTWMVFDKLFGSYPPEMDSIKGNSLIGWNKTVSNPSVDIPMALKLFDELSAPSASYTDKWTRMEAITELFYRQYEPDKEARFITEESNNPNTYEMLRTMNPAFYNWILEQIKLVDNAIVVERENFIMPDKRYVFDIRPSPTAFDQTYTAHPYEIGIFNFNEAMVLANKLFVRFLTIFEQVLYRYTKQIFPLKLYATISYLFNAYVRIIVNFLKPYHASLIEKDPLLRVGGDIFDSINVGDYFKTRMHKQLIDGVLNKLTDDPQDGSAAFDGLKKIREQIKEKITYNVYTPFYFNVHLDSAPFNVDDLIHGNDYVIREEMQIYEQGPLEKSFLADSKNNWQFWISSMNSVYSLDVLDWDYDTQTVTNNWDRDVILIARQPIQFETTRKDGSGLEQENVWIGATSTVTGNVRFAFALRYFTKPRFDFYRFDAVPTPTTFDVLRDKGFGEWWVYKEGWKRINLPCKAYYDKEHGLYVRGTASGEGLYFECMMTADELATLITPPTMRFGYVWPAIYLPTGASFSSLTLNFDVRKKLYPVFA